MTSWLRYLIAFVVGAHEFTSIPFGLVVPGKLKVWRGRSWLLGSTISGDRLRTLVLALHIAAGVAILAWSIAIAFASSGPSRWRPLAIVGGSLGLAAFAVFWDGQVKLVQEGGIGAAASLILLMGAIALPGAFT